MGTLGMLQVSLEKPGEVRAGQVGRRHKGNTRQLSQNTATRREQVEPRVTSTCPLRCSVSSMWSVWATGGCIRLCDHSKLKTPHVFGSPRADDSAPRWEHSLKLPSSQSSLGHLLHGRCLCRWLSNNSSPKVTSGQLTSDSQP